MNPSLPRAAHQKPATLHTVFMTAMPWALAAAAAVSWAADSRMVVAGEFQIPKQYAAPATYTVVGSTVKKEQSRPFIGYWDGTKVIWSSSVSEEIVHFSDVRQLLRGGSFYGTSQVIYKPMNIDNRYSSTNDQTSPLKIVGGGGTVGAPQGNFLGFGQQITLTLDTSSNPFGIGFSRGERGPRGDSGSWRQQFSAQSTIRINQPGARAGERVRVRVRGELAGGSAGGDLQRSALEARILIDQVADLRIAGPNPNPRPTYRFDNYVDIPVNTDLRWQFSFNLYGSGQEGTHDIRVYLDKQTITLELPALSGTPTTSLAPPAKPLTGGAVATPNMPGAIVVPGQPSGGTTITRPAQGTGTSAPLPSGSATATPGAPRTGALVLPGAPSTGGTLVTPGAPAIGTPSQPQRSFGVVPRGIEAETGREGSQK